MILTEVFLVGALAGYELMEFVTWFPSKGLNHNFNPGGIEIIF